MPAAVLAIGGLVFLSVFASAGADRALAGQNDFLPFYAGARLAFSGHLYDPARVLAEERRWGNASGESLHFIRPPWFAALLWPLAQQGYARAYRIWEVLLAVCIGAFVVWWKPAGWAPSLIAVCFSLPALAALMNGQDTPLLIAFMTAAAVLHRRGRPFAAGLALALCQTKFHLFLPLWLILLAGGRWRTFAGMAAGNGLLGAAGFAIAGWRWAFDYLSAIGRDAVTPGAAHMPTVYHALAGLGLPAWWIAAPGVLVAAGAWQAGKRFDLQTGIAIAPALIMPFVAHTYMFDGVLLLPLLVTSLEAECRWVRGAAIALLSPMPWIGCLMGYPWSLAAPVLVLILLLAHFRLKLGGSAPIRELVRRFPLFVPKLLVVAALSIAAFAQSEGLVRVTENDAKKAIVSKVDPEYPAMARSMHLAGRAVVDVYIDTDGKVEKAQPVSGNPLLTGAAVSAVKKWKFNNSFGKKAVATFAFDFKL